MMEIQGKSILVRPIRSQRTVKYFHSMIQYFTFAVVKGWPQRKLNSGVIAPLKGRANRFKIKVSVFENLYL